MNKISGILGLTIAPGGNRQTQNHTSLFSESTTLLFSENTTLLFSENTTLLFSGYS